MKFFYAFLLSTTIFQFAPISPIHAWGPTGHRVIGEIAERNLTPHVRLEIKKLLDGKSLAEVSTWADEVRSDSRYDFSVPWHFVEIPIGTNYDPNKASPKGDLLVEIQTMSDIVKGKKATLKINDIVIGKKEALKFLVHFVGDLHQPFHIGNGRDRGGHLCAVKWFGSTDNGGKPWNLHSVWDDGIINSLLLSFTELTKFILDKKLPNSELKKIKNSKPLDWANESKEFQAELYPGIKLYTQETAEPEFCKSEKSELPNLGYDYRYQVIDITKLRLREAGLRLATLLNKLFQKP